MHACVRMHKCICVRALEYVFLVCDADGWASLLSVVIALSAWDCVVFEGFACAVCLVLSVRLAIIPPPPPLSVCRSRCCRMAAWHSIVFFLCLRMSESFSDNFQEFKLFLNPLFPELSSAHALDPEIVILLFFLSLFPLFALTSSNRCET